MATATKSRKATGVKLQPLNDRVVVEREEEQDVTTGGIVLPDSAREKPARGRVISVGNGRLLDDGTRSELQVQEGDHVLFTSYGPDTITIGEEEYLLMKEEDILAIIEG